MGFFDDFSGLFADIQDSVSQIQGIKDDFIASVLDDSAELRDAASDIHSGATEKINDINPFKKG